MKVHNVHERRLPVPAAEVEALFSDMDPLWPTHVFPAPQPEGDALRIGPMLWQPVAREGSARAYEVIAPPEFRVSHWFEIEESDGSTTLRHTVEGEAVGEFAPVWRERVEPMHNAYIEAIFDRAQELLS